MDIYTMCACMYTHTSAPRNFPRTPGIFYDFISICTIGKLD